MNLKQIGAYIMLAILFLLLFLFFFKPEVFYNLMRYTGPGGPFVHPPTY